MNINSNRWNIIRYTIYTPIYDLFGRILKHSRRKAIDMLNIQHGDKVLIVGAGTGLDFEIIHNKCEITATDLTPSMVAAMKRRSKKLNRKINCMKMDAQQLSFAEESFDCVILNLILAIVPEPVNCFKEAERVLKTGGHMLIFDKLLQKHKKPSLIRKILNPITNLLFSRINLSFTTVYKHSSMKIKADKPTFWNLFRIIVLKK